jgi:hypothetical protein
MTLLHLPKRKLAPEIDQRCTPYPEATAKAQKTVNARRRKKGTFTPQDCTAERPSSAAAATAVTSSPGKAIPVAAVCWSASLTRQAAPAARQPQGTGARLTLLFHKPSCVVSKEVGAPASRIRRVERECPDAPAQRPRSRYLGPRSKHTTASVMVNVPRPRVEVAGRSLVHPCPFVSLVPGVCVDNIGGTSCVSPFGRLFVSLALPRPRPHF